MTAINHPRPTFSAEEAAAVLHALFGVSGRLEALPSERDQNFRVTAADGREFIFKIVNAAEPQTAVAFQTALLRHVEAVDPDLPVPRIVPTPEGEDFGFATGRGGERHALRLVTWLAGTPLAEAQKTPGTLRDLGRVLGRLDWALQSFGHPGAHHAFDWEIREVPRSRARLSHIADPARRRLVETVLDTYDSRVAPALKRLRCGVIHNDANDWNLLVAGPTGGPITGLIDFGDAVHSPLVAELAIACAYAMLGAASPVEAAAAIVAGYHAELPLQEAEFEVLMDLVAARLAVSVSISATRHAAAAENPYLLVSEKPAWDLLERLARIDRRIATAILRKACGLEAAPGVRRLGEWLAANRRTLAPMLRPHPARQRKCVLDLGSPDAPLPKASAAGDHAAADRAYAELQKAHGFDLGLGPHGEKRTVYTAPFFRSALIDGARRDLHLGLDVFAPAGTPLYTPLAAKVVAATVNPAPQDYGGLLLLEHEPEPGLRFQTLWGHLDHASVRERRVGEELPAGAFVARLGDYAENGGWVPHLHLQLVASPYDDASIIPGVGEEAFREVWAELFPAPYDFAGLPPETFERGGRDRASLLAARKARLGPNLSVSYREPLKMVRGEDVWLIDDTGRAYLDCYNNVAHVGHCHPRVVDAITRQVPVLNTNTRYLHDTIVDYTERLATTLPPELDTFFVLCTGSEANELALRMARTCTARRDVLVLDWAYHGNTQGLVDISPYKYKRKGGAGRPEHTHELPVPDPYRAPSGWPAAEIGERYADEAVRRIGRMAADGRAPGAFIAETIPSVAGQIFLPPGYLRAVYAAVRAAGGLCIADEVQVGFGRVGNAMWAFEEHGVVPDIVTMGKPIGNGHPLAVVAVRREIAERFANGMEYFNTFGGNPVSCAAGLAVLDVLEEERLLPNAAEQGGYLLTGMRRLMERHPAVGDVRGRGLFFGIELVRDRATKEHAGAEAAAVVNRARELGVLMGTDGPFDNVVKLRPPMTFRREHADILLDVLGEAIRDVLG
ncbi:aminotransferase class III-fold pyridoxal phosphate-dependent enzyme [Chelatococcus sp. SYSU_G07232]|uniref:Aminotransferase class III-fold pyridoxal phosphate-dependent enzyme n=1 Tax=Chelatococcus albus TaxID=3047466 RepID=A0ABT7ALP9_9HYPH|nr:aminotransferase class III-fold pyridoxal phosphate-dependent enzyme [Chelatococcus sp. SYSU_G07232]MDJ1160000.1 aminotransferase class III-fold pyridoxal phosphate-dependent enzyme [Chelatococcus sp. SYSU_G07232]